MLHAVGYSLISKYECSDIQSQPPGNNYKALISPSIIIIIINQSFTTTVKEYCEWGKESTQIPQEDCYIRVLHVLGE